MSLCRMNSKVKEWPMSDVYIYVNQVDENGLAAVWYCCEAKGLNQREILHHVIEHIMDGDIVPETVIPDILARSIG